MQANIKVSLYNINLFKCTKIPQFYLKTKCIIKRRTNHVSSRACSRKQVILRNRIRRMSRKGIASSCLLAMTTRPSGFVNDLKDKLLQPRPALRAIILIQRVRRFTIRTGTRFFDRRRHRAFLPVHDGVICATSHPFE